ncbi:MAG: RagB/SusD family nutrient uptake outer membrane protein [Bacteroidota bacterium]|nr:RagB/SusD family nutrient uptake outer membrane protein [Bacteroidota bacterium]
MKNINKLLLLGAIAGLSLSSCKKEYLETRPTDQIDASSVLTTTENAKTALNGIHRSMFMRYNNQGEFGYGTIMLNNETLGEDYVLSGQSNGWWLGFYRWVDHRNSNSGNCEFPWRFFYRIISNSNVLINGVDGASGTVAEKNNIKGQSLAYRAWAYFNLVQLYGIRFDKNTANANPGVPLLLTNTIVGQPRSTVAQVYTQVNADLNAAEALLTTTRADKTNFNVNVVRGLQARVALTQQDWDRAATKAASARSGFTLMTAAQQLEGYNLYDNPEWMWGSRQIDDQTEFFTAYLAYISYNFNSTNIRTNPKCINNTLYNTMAATDVRRPLWVPAPTTTNSITPPGGLRNPFMNQKFKAKDFANSVGDIPNMRVAEMILIEAEARARNGQDGLAAAALFVLMANRVPGSVLSANTGAALLAEIMNSRRVELWGEGFRFLDLKRLDISLDRNGANHNTALALTMNMAAGSLNWQYAIPIAEINANPLVTQNP